MKAHRSVRGLARLARWRGWLPRVAEAQLLFPAFALVFIALLWAATGHFITNERTDAAHVSSVLSREMADTYEAQVVRALHDIDQTLKFIQYVYEQKGQVAVLNELKTRALLLPDLIFTISIVDRQGSVVASTRQGGSPDLTALAFFSGPAHNGKIWVSPPQLDPVSGETLLKFSRSMRAADGVFADVITISEGEKFLISAGEFKQEQRLFGSLRRLQVIQLSESWFGDDAASELPPFPCFFRPLRPSLTDLSQRRVIAAPTPTGASSYAPAQTAGSRT